MKLGKIVIVGTGLIGGSIGRAFIERGLAKEVVGLCRRRSSLSRALKAGAVTGGFVNDYTRALDGADIVFIATPVETVKDVLKRMSGIKLRKGLVVTDAGSTKKDIVRFAEKFRDKFCFLGSHPLAGSEKTGVEYSSADLFRDSICIVTPSENTPKKTIELVRGLWEKLEARVEILSPEEHDRILAYTSHLPHAVAYSLAASEMISFARFSATGFRDTTRIASSDPELWAEIFMTNRKNILSAITRFRRELSEIERSIKNEDMRGLIKVLKKGKKVRDEIIQERQNYSDRRSSRKR